MKTKQKSVTMWAIWDPYYKCFILYTFSPNQWFSWNLFLQEKENKHFGTRENAYHKGFRAVKGKFVWEEKC